MFPRLPILFHGQKNALRPLLCFRPSLARVPSGKQRPVLDVYMRILF
jgi:hypothetical protein